MPPVAAAAVATAFAAAGAYAAGTAITASFLATSFFGSIIMSGISSKLAPKPDKPDLSSFASIKQTGSTQQFRQSVTDRRAVYGEVRTSGPIVFVGSTGGNEFLHMVIAVATHEITSFEEFLLNDESVPLDAIDGNGMVTTGTFANNLWIHPHLGANDQLADADLIAAFPDKWSSDHRLRGIAYVYCKLKFNQDVYPSGIPNISAWVRGKKVIDVRDISVPDTRVTEEDETRITEDGSIRETEDSTDVAPLKWTSNIALQALDNLTDPDYGLGADFSTVESVEASAAANTCDEIVTTKNIMVTVTSADPATNLLTLEGEILDMCRGDMVQAGVTTITGITTAIDYFLIPYQRQGTVRIKLAATMQDAMDGIAIDITSGGTATLIKSGEPRYHGGGILKMATERGANFQEILSGMGGRAIPTGGRWYLQAGEYRIPEVALDEHDMAGRITVLPKVSERERFNRIQGIYIGNLNAGNPSDYPVVESLTYQAADGKVLKRSMDLSFTQRPQTAQRIAKIELERARQEIIFTASFKLSAFKVRCGDNFYFSFARYGWTDKVFECIGWRLSVEEDSEGIPRPVIEMTCRENAAAVYAFSSPDEESVADPAPNTDLPNPFRVGVVGGFSLTSVPVNTEAGDRTFKIRASWDAPDDSFVTQGGKFEIWFKQSTETEWGKFPPVDGSAVQTDLFQAELDTLYDLQIRAINNLGRKSQFSPIYGFVVGTSSITETEDWEFVVEARDPDDWETDSGPSEDWET